MYGIVLEMMFIARDRACTGQGLGDGQNEVS